MNSVDQTEELLDEGGHRGPGAAMPIIPIMPSSMRRLRRFKPRELDGFVFPSLQDELVVDDVYLRVLVKEAIVLRGTEAAQEPAGSGDGLGQGLALPSDLLVRRPSCDKISLVCVKSHVVVNRKYGGCCRQHGSEAILPFPFLTDVDTGFPSMSWSAHRHLCSCIWVTRCGLLRQDRFRT